MSNSQKAEQATQAAAPVQPVKPDGPLVKPTGSLIYVVQKGVNIFPTWRKAK